MSPSLMAAELSVVTANPFSLYSAKEVEDLRVKVMSWIKQLFDLINPSANAIPIFPAPIIVAFIIKMQLLLKIILLFH